MASLIKNQIIKRLSKFVKNLSSNQINLSTFKGEGELSSIDLDEAALEDVTELPTWLKIQKATCGRVFIKIPWTSLKTLPIQLQLDDVSVEIETCEQLRDLHNLNDPSASGADSLMGKYGFTNRVIDGISLSITNITFTIKAQGFKASIFLPSLDIYSTTPYGKKTDSLRTTRIRNIAKDHILLFKEISFPNARIEASSNDSTMQAAAIRLIVNACRIRISMKKNLQDSSMVSSRLMLHFDDLLWVVNDAQLKSALNTYKEITQMIKRASEQRKRKAGDKLTKLEQQQQPSTFQPKAPTTGTNELNNSMNASTGQQGVNDPFVRYDVVETSLHFNVKRLDLHIIADSDVLSDRLAESGALQMTIANLSIDHYPYHEHGSSKKHWIQYSELQSSNRDSWAAKLYDNWHEQLNVVKGKVPNDEMSIKLEKALRTNRIRLFESCTVINIDDLVFYPVSLNTGTSGSRNSKEQKRRRPLITSDRTHYQLPEFLGVINIQHTEYYFPLPYAFPVPDSDLYIQIMPVVIRVDFATSSWLDAFASTLSLTIDKSGVLQHDGPTIDPEHVAIQIEAMLPRIVVSSDIFSNAYELQEVKEEHDPTVSMLQHDEIANQKRIETLELNISKVTITNVRTEMTSTREKLEQHLALFQETTFFDQTQWPLSAETATTRISPMFEKHPYEAFLYKNPLSTEKKNLSEPKSASSALHSYYTMTTDSLKKSVKCDIWHFMADNIYMDFTPTSSSAAVLLAKQNMTDTLSLSGWGVFQEKRHESSSSPWINILCVVETPSMLKLSQKQYTFIMHLVDEFGIFLDVLDRNKVQTRLLKQQQGTSSSSPPIDDLKFTVCLTIPTTFTLTVLDGLEDAVLTVAPPAPTLPEADLEPILRDTSEANVVVDLLTTPAPIVAGTAKIDSPSTPSINIVQEIGPNGNLNKGFGLLSQKKSKIEETLQRGLELSSKGSRASSQSSLLNMSDNGDDPSSQWDQASEDMDADLDSALGMEFEPQSQQQKAARIELDDDSISLTGKIGTTNAFDSVKGVFLKLNQIRVCITEDEHKDGKPLYVACNVKHVSVDEFKNLKLDTIKPKLFDNERIDEFNDANVPPVNVRIDFPKGSESSPPIVTLQAQDRSLAVTSHAVDVLTMNLEEIHTSDERRVQKIHPHKFVPIDVRLQNFQLILELLHEHPTTDAVVETKPTMKINIEQLRLLRQVDGQVTIQTPKNNDDENQTIPSPLSTPTSNDSVDLREKIKQAEVIRLENERLRTELNIHKQEIGVLRGERDSLMNTISKLDIELTQAQHQRSLQLQQQQPSVKK